MDANSRPVILSTRGSCCSAAYQDLVKARNTWRPGMSSVAIESDEPPVTILLMPSSTPQIVPRVLVCTLRPPGVCKPSGVPGPLQTPKSHLVSRPDINDSYTSDPAYINKGPERSCFSQETLQFCIGLFDNERKAAVNFSLSAQSWMMSLIRGPGPAAERKRRDADCNLEFHRILSQLVNRLCA